MESIEICIARPHSLLCRSPY